MTVHGMFTDLFDGTMNLVGLTTSTMNDTTSSDKINNNNDSPPTTACTNKHVDASYDYLERMVLVADPTSSCTMEIPQGASTEAVGPDTSSSAKERRRMTEHKRNTSTIHDSVEQRVNRIISSEQSSQSTKRSNNIHQPSKLRSVPSNQSFDQFSLLTPQHLTFPNNNTFNKTTTSPTKETFPNSNDIVQSQTIDHTQSYPASLRENQLDKSKDCIGNTVIPTTTDDLPDVSRVDFYQKYESILQCLKGQNDSTERNDSTEVEVENTFIDLWELRELAVQKGGLLCPSLRKRAWPILCNSHVHVMLTNYHRYNPNHQDGTTSNGKTITPSNVVVSQTDLQSLTADIRCKFKKYDMSNNMDGGCSVSNGISTLSSGSSIVSDIADDEEMVHPTTMSSDVHKHHIIVEDDGTSANYSNLKANVSIKSVHEKSQQTVKKRTLFNIVSTVLQQQPLSTIMTTVPTTIQTDTNDTHTSIDCSIHSRDPTNPDSPPRARCSSSSSSSSSTTSNSSNGSSQIDDHNFHYFDGLVHLTDVILSNLDSPSLTTLILTKLANYHLRDAFRMTSSTSTDRTLSSSPSPLDTGVMILFVPLLRSLEYGLYKEVIVTACQKYHPDGLAFGIQILCSIIAKHTSTWFCTAFCDARGEISMEDRNEAASRLVDVCLVSHPLFPLYLAVSILAVRKQRNGGRLCKWHSREDLSGQFTNLFYLNTIPTTGTDNAEHALTSTPLSVVVEEIISKCLHYMKQVPPEALLAKANISSITKVKRVGPSLRHISCLQTIPPPDWCLLDRTPTECTLVMQRGRLDPNCFSKSVVHQVNDNRYPTAFVACGFSRESPSTATHHIRQVGSPNSAKTHFHSIRSVAKTVRFHEDTIVIQSWWHGRRFPSRRSFVRIGAIILLSVLMVILAGLNFSVTSYISQFSSTSDSIIMKSLSSVVNYRNSTTYSMAEKSSFYYNTTTHPQILGGSIVPPSLKIVYTTSSISKLISNVRTYRDVTLLSSGSSQSTSFQLNDRSSYESSIVFRTDGGSRGFIKGYQPSKSDANMVRRLDQQSLSSYPGGIILDLIKSVFYMSFLRKVGLIMYLYNYLNFQGLTEACSKPFSSLSDRVNKRTKSSKLDSCTNTKTLHITVSGIYLNERTPISRLIQGIKSLHVQMKQFTKSVTKHSISLLQLHGASKYMAVANASHIVRESTRIVNNALNSCMDGVFDLVNKSFQHLALNLRALIIY